MELQTWPAEKWKTEREFSDLFVENLAEPPVRTMERFAEEEIVIPNGPFKGRRFSCARQPYSRLLFRAIDSGLWRRHFITGPTQSGKTLSSWAIPACYHLFEMVETVILGIPSMDMAFDKWEQDLKPVIEASRFRDLLPTHGAGSRGGKFNSITFLNGATLKFMSGGGDDKKRSAYTSRVLIVTETDGLDESGATSREADKLTQLEARTRAYASRARCYFECTVSIEQGRTWQEYTSGTESRIVVRCGHCGVWVTPEREHLQGWQGAENKVQARVGAAFVCPECSVVWTSTERHELQADAMLVHRGQEVTPEGEIVGPAPETDTLGFRWNAFNNLFVTPGDIGEAEWASARSSDSDNAEKAMRQFWWALPHEPEASESVPLDVDAICRRVSDTSKGILPARKADGRAVVIDYGMFDIPSHNMVEGRAIQAALRQFRATCEAGWKGQGEDEIVLPDAVWIDSRYETEAVNAFCAAAGERYRPTMGFGTGRFMPKRYSAPRKVGGETRFIGDRYHFSKVPKRQLQRVDIDVDYWKTRAHQGLTNLATEPGAICLYRADPQEHMTLARHLTAEIQVEEWVPGEGFVTRWERKRKSNHFLDSMMLAVVAGHHQPAARLTVGVDLGKFVGHYVVIAWSPLPERESVRPKVITDWFASQRSRE